MKSFLMVIRGFLIGTAEAIPGISGGTVALIVGIYKFLIDSISNFFLRVFGIVNKSLGKNSVAKACTHCNWYGAWFDFDGEAYRTAN
jgi:putative membrane protein